MESYRKYGEWAVVTGGSSGIGRAIAEDLAKRGYKLVLVARTQADLIAVGAALKTECQTIAADLCTVEGRVAVMEQTQSLPVGLFVHSAGLAHVGAFLSAPPDADRQLIDIHCAATVELSRHFATRFKARGRGGLVLVSSGFGYSPIPYAAVYGAAKSFVISFGEALSEELRASNIDVLTVIPGGTKTNMAVKLADLIDLTQMPMPMGDPAMVARSTLHALGRKDRVVPGLPNKIMASLMTVMPTGLAKALMGRMLRGALKTQPN